LRNTIKSKNRGQLSISFEKFLRFSVHPRFFFSLTNKNLAPTALSTYCFIDIITANNQNQWIRMKYFLDGGNMSRYILRISWIYDIRDMRIRNFLEDHYV